MGNFTKETEKQNPISGKQSIKNEVEKQTTKGSAGFRNKWSLGG